MAATQDLPHTGTVHIKPKKDAKVVGDSKYSGKQVIGASGKVYVLPGRMFVLPGDGVVLNLAKPENWKTYDILMGPNPGIQAWFKISAKFRYRYDIVDLVGDAEKYLANDELKTDYKAQVMKLKDTELKTIGFMFKLGKDAKMIKAGLYKMIDDDTTRAKVGKFLLSTDRFLLTYVYHALANGNEGEKTGLYRTSRDLYFFNTTPLGLGEDSVLAYLKKETDDATAIYEIIKGEYETALIEESRSK